MSDKKKTFEDWINANLDMRDTQASVRSFTQKVLSLNEWEKMVIESNALNKHQSVIRAMNNNIADTIDGAAYYELVMMMRVMSLFFQHEQIPIPQEQLESIVFYCLLYMYIQNNLTGDNDADK